MKRDIRHFRTNPNEPLVATPTPAAPVGRSVAVFELDGSFSFDAGNRLGEDVGPKWFGADDYGTPVWDFTVVNDSPTIFNLDGSRLAVKSGIYMATMTFVVSPSTPTVGSIGTFDPWFTWQINTSYFYRDEWNQLDRWHDFYDMYDTGLAVWTGLDWTFTVSQVCVAGRGGDEVLGNLWITQLAPITQACSIQASVKLCRVADIQVAIPSGVPG